GGFDIFEGSVAECLAGLGIEEMDRVFWNTCDRGLARLDLPKSADGCDERSRIRSFSIEFGRFLASPFEGEIHVITAPDRLDHVDDSPEVVVGFHCVDEFDVLGTDAECHAIRLAERVARFRRQRVLEALARETIVPDRRLE